MLIFFYRSQNGARIGFGQVEIQEDQTGPGGVLIRRDFTQEPERLLAIGRDRNLKAGF